MRTDQREPQYQGLRPLKNKIKKAKIVCCSNTVATYNVILSGDIKTNYVHATKYQNVQSAGKELELTVNTLNVRNVLI